QQNRGLQSRLVMDRNTAARFGITHQMIDDTLYDAFGQRQVSTMFTQLNQYRVVLEVQSQLQRNPQDLTNIYIRPAPAGAVANIHQAARDMKLPASIVGSFQGTAQAFETWLTNEPLLILAALITVYIVLGVLYESYIHPVTILSTLPSAGVGALLALLIFGQEMDVIALIGIILLIEIVKKH